MKGGCLCWGPRAPLHVLLLGLPAWGEELNVRMLRAMVGARFLGVGAWHSHIGAGGWWWGREECLKGCPTFQDLKEPGDHSHHPSIMDWLVARVLKPEDSLPLLGGPASGHTGGPHFWSLAILRHVQCGPDGPHRQSSPSSACPLPVCHCPCGLWGAQSLQPDWKLLRDKQLLSSIFSQCSGRNGT